VALEFMRWFKKQNKPRNSSDEKGKIKCFSEGRKKLNSYISVQGDTLEKYFWGFFVWIKTWYVYLLFEKKIVDTIK
jgi:hypothetical protein